MFRLPSKFPKIARTFCSHKPSDFELQHINPKCIKAESKIVALYGGRHTVTMLPGTGIGPELCRFVRVAFKEMGAPVDFEIIHVDAEREDTDELEFALISIRRNGVAIKGNLEKKSELSMFRLNNVILRSTLDLYAYVLKCKSYPNIPAKHQNVDVVLIRQNTEGEYSMLEHSIGYDKVVESLKIVRKDASLRLVKYAFDYALKNNRKKITTIHKANIMKLSDGLFLETAKEVAKEYPDIKHNEMIIDNCCMQMVNDPHQFDVVLAPNLYGSILANIMCGLTGGPGLMSGKNYGDYYAIFETGTRSNGTAIAGKNLANPVAMLDASAEMLRHLGHQEYADRLQKAIFKTICEDKLRTRDIGGTDKSSDVMDRILENL